MIEILRAHRARYPLMEPQDAVKLLYQRAYGPGHMVKSREDALKRVLAELETLDKSPDAPLFESIGLGLTRMNLKAEALPRPETVAGMLYRSAQRPPRPGFQDELNALVSEWPECAPFVEAYRASGCPMCSHSEAYRAAYAPAYRVILSKFQRLIEVFRKIDALPPKTHLLIAIDGRCGSGKSTLAALIGSVYGATVLHMDDFFLTEAQKAEGMKTPVTNIDVKRLMAALTPLSEGKGFEYRPYSCPMGDFKPPKKVSPARISVVEGTYCLTPCIRLNYDLKIFMSVDSETQKARIHLRNPDLYEPFVTKWIPQEEAYFQRFGIAEGCLPVDGRQLNEEGEDAAAYIQSRPKEE